MRRLTYAGLLLLLLHCAASAQPAAQPSRPSPVVISGQVLDEQGRPVAGARVGAVPDNGLKGILPRDLSDASGRFTLEAHQTGWFTIYILKEDDGYANSYNPFYYPTVDPSARVLVEEGRPTRFATVRFAPRSGKVSALVFDAETNRPVADFRVSLCRVEAPKFCRSLFGRHPGGRFQFLAPSVPFTIQVSAEGFEDWDGGAGPDRLPAILRVASGEAKELRVALQKSSGVYYGANGPGLQAPQPVSPAEGAVLYYHFPRETKLFWSPVAGAASYTVEVEVCMPGGPEGRDCAEPRSLEWNRSPPQSGLVETSYEFPFPGAQPGRWRVWAVDAQGRAGAKSPWINFVYAQ